MRNKFRNSSATYRGLLSDNKNGGMPYGIIQLSNSYAASYDVDAFAVIIAHVSFEQQSVLMTTNWFHLSVREHGREYWQR